MTIERTTLTRRRLLTAAGIGAAAASVPVLPGITSAAADTTDTSLSADATCVASPAEQEVGPFFVQDGLVRSDVAEGEDGIPLTLKLTFTSASTCSVLEGAYIDIWSANAAGVYSDESSEDTTGETYLRGIQQTDSNGQVTFSTIYPGWYSGRTEHIHFRVYTGGSVSGTTYDYTSATLQHTGQVFFDADTNATVAGLSPYSSNTVTRTTNSEDRVYTEQSGSDNILTLTGNTSDGFTGTISLESTGTSTTTSSGSADASSVTLKRSKATVVAGSEVTLSGTLTDTTTSSVLVDEEVEITATTAGGSSLAKSLETGSAGKYSLTFKPMRTANYKTTYDGDSSHDVANSSTETVTVAYRLLVNKISAKSVKGTLYPPDAGKEVTLQLLQDNGKLRKLAVAKTDGSGAWTARLHLANGRHRIRATVPAGSQNAAGTSRTVTVKKD